MIKKILKNTYVFNVLKKNKQRLNTVKEGKLIIKQWIQNGRPAPPPQLYKRQIIKEYAKKFQLKALLETGTYLGDTVEDCRKMFNKIFSIELDDQLFEKATKRFETSTHISIVHGDSGEKIKEILKKLNEPCLFWLDGHYSEGITAKGDLNTPIINELTYIFNHSIDSHVILIDDARCFTGSDDYPTINALKKFVNDKKPAFKFSVADDIIRIHK